MVSRRRLSQLAEGVAQYSNPRDLKGAVREGRRLFMSRSTHTLKQPSRLPRGGCLDRTRPVRFRFDGKNFSGYAGDTLASALLAAGIRLLGRSFKYHRPRGILTAGSEEPNALVELRTGSRREPNTRATMVELY